MKRLRPEFLQKLWSGSEAPEDAEILVGDIDLKRK